LKLKHVLTAFFAVYIISLSFVPLIHDRFLAQEKWTGYGTGAYQFQNQRYFVLFNDPYDGSSKPHIHVNPDFAPAARISLLEFSDWTSYVNDQNLFNEFNITVRANSNVLAVTYTGTNITIYKFVQVTQDAVNVRLNSTKEFRAHLELWRWVMTSINGISIKEVSKALTIPVTNRIDFTFEDEQLQSVGHGSILLSAPPVQVQIWPHETGFNKITIDFVNSLMTLTVSGSMKAVGTPSPTWDYSMLPYVLPIVSIAVVALYLLVDKYGRTLKNRASRVGR
jgi:hypothetical protein